MTTTTTDTTTLRDLLQGAGLEPGRVLTDGPAYEQATALWNRQADSYPRLVVRPTDVREVRETVRLVGEAGLALTVRGGAHDWNGRASRVGGVMLDLGLMRHVESRDDTLVVGGGATNLDVVRAAERAGRAVAAGNVGAVGFAGLTLGGGYGPLLGRFGLAADHLVAAQVVLADGRAVVADDQQHPDLLWALKGGGGNFGVVTSLTVRLHPAVPIRSGLVAFPLAEAPAVLTRYAALLADTGTHLTADAGVFTLPDGPAVVFVAPTWVGDASQGDAVLGRVSQLGTPVVDTIAPSSHSAILETNDAIFAGRGNWRLATRNLPRLTDDAIDTLVSVAQSRTSPQSAVYWHHFHGAAAAVAPPSAAFGERRDHLMVELIAHWPDSDQPAAHRDWLARSSADLGRSSLPGGYPNLLADDDHDQIADAYGANTRRLHTVKATYDPHGMFTAIPLPR